MTEQNFIIKHEVFEGPLDLLLSLIEKRKLLINEISLAKITDDYISHIKEITDYKLTDRANFIVISSTLILIKSRSLLPGLTLSPEEEEGIEDLENRLRIYQKIKELSLHVKKSYEGESIYFARDKKNTISLFVPDKNITMSEMLSGLKNIIARFPKVTTTPKTIVKQVVSLEEMMDKLQDRIQSAIKMSFRDFSGVKKVITQEDKVHIIVSFLAMLELVKQGLLDVKQDSRFDDIEIEKTNIGVPVY